MPRFPTYVSAAERRARVQAALVRLGKKPAGHEPIEIEGKAITTTFWGQAWCDNLESYADFAYRLDRGRSYVRSGAVVDLRIAAGTIEAHVSGSDLYRVGISITKLPAPRWKAMAARCAGAVASLVSLLRGQLSHEVLRAVTDRKSGLFPEPRQIRMTCSCPDAATLCKHVAASLYGVGTRLDARPELLFELRGVDPQDLIQHATDDLVTTSDRAPAALEPQGDDLGALFGIDLVSAEPPAVVAAAVARSPRKKRSAKRSV